MPENIAIPRTTTRKAIINFVVNMDFKRITSGRLAPALPIINAITAPIPIPFATKAALKGINVTARRYKGIPTTAANGIAAGLSSLAYFAIKSVGTKP